MEKIQPLVAIIIVNYNTPDLTKDCLSSLFKIKTSGFDHQIIVVDNGSIEQFSLPKKWGKKPVEIIRTQANIGFTGGNNLGISHAVKEYDPDYFLFLNSDTAVKPDFLEQLFQCSQTNDQVGITSPKIYFHPGNEFHQSNYNSDQKGQVLWYAGGSIDWQNLVAFHRGVDEVDRGQFNQFGKLQPLDLTQAVSQTDFATGCCMLIKREVIEKVGILDKKYFLYLEDVDFSLAAKNKGFGLYFCPDSVVWHKNAGSSQGAGSQIHLYYQTRNRLLFFFRHGNLKVKLTVLKMMIKLFFSGERVKRKAVIDFLFRQFGKQPVI